jgi:hypothetical protein
MLQDPISRKEKKKKRKKETCHTYSRVSLYPLPHHPPNQDHFTSIPAPQDDLRTIHIPDQNINPLGAGGGTNFN